MESPYKEFVNFANSIADEASKISMDYFRTTLDINDKEDMSPVTVADKNIELKIRELINETYPTHGILGEEFDQINSNAEFVWVIDPIDGTRSFIAGHKDFGNLIALLHNNNPVIGIINCPAHKERWVGIKNEVTTCNGEKVTTSKENKLENSYLFTSGIYFDEPILKNGYELIKNKVRYYRLGGDCYMYGMLTSGLIDIVVEDTLKVHDYMALINVIEGAGGKITDKFGKDITINSDGSVIASCNENIQKQLINLING